MAHLEIPHSWCIINLLWNSSCCDDHLKQHLMGKSLAGSLESSVLAIAIPTSTPQLNLGSFFPPVQSWANHLPSLIVMMVAAFLNWKSEENGLLLSCFFVLTSCFLSLPIPDSRFYIPATSCLRYTQCSLLWILLLKLCAFLLTRLLGPSFDVIFSRKTPLLSPCHYLPWVWCLFYLHTHHCGQPLSY